MTPESRGGWGGGNVGHEVLTAEGGVGKVSLVRREVLVGGVGLLWEG